VAHGVALPLLALVVWWAVHRGWRRCGALGAPWPRASRRRCSRSAARRAHRDAPMVDALNGLFGRIARCWSERRFTADAAHELRTPIAAIRTQAQVALAEPTTPRAATRCAPRWPAATAPRGWWSSC
jgi:two-component system sensor histidine kinase QseC